MRKIFALLLMFGLCYTMATVIVNYATPIVARADQPAGNGNTSGGGGGGDSISSPNGTLSVGGTSSATTLDLANPLAVSQSFSNFANFTYAPVAVCQTNAQIAPVCIGSPTGTIALAIGKVSGGWGGTTTANSGSIALCRNNGTSDGCATILFTSGGNLTFSGIGGSVLTNGANFSAGAGNVTGNHINQNAGCSGTTPQTGNSACRITSASSTATMNFTNAFTSIPACTATDETSATALKVAPSTSAVTVTGQGASDVIDIICRGNPT